MKMLDKFAPHGTVVHVLAQKPMKIRDKAIGGSQWQNIRLEHQLCDRTNTQHLKEREELLFSASSVLVLAESVGQTAMEGGVLLDLGDEDCAGDDAITSDSACLMCMIMVTDVLEAKHRAHTVQFASQGQLGEAVTKQPSQGRRTGPYVVCEMLDPRTDRLLNRNTELTKMGTFFRSNLIETGMFSMAATEPMVFNALQRLMSPGIGDLAAVPLSDYVSTAHAPLSFSFWDLHDMVRNQRGDLLVGWQQANDERPELSPTKHKTHQKSWTGEEMLVVIRKPLAESGYQETSDSTSRQFGN